MLSHKRNLSLKYMLLFSTITLSSFLFFSFLCQTIECVTRRKCYEEPVTEALWSKEFSGIDFIYYNLQMLWHKILSFEADVTFTLE